MVHRIDVVHDLADVAGPVHVLVDLELEDVRQRRLGALDAGAEHRLLPDVHPHEAIGVGRVSAAPSSRPSAWSAAGSAWTSAGLIRTGGPGGSGSGMNAEYPAACRT
jgi:hypothetical protein